MESFEHLVKVFFEGHGFAVSTNVKFPVRRQTKKKVHDEWQEHGYEIDIVAARAKRLVLASVKSYFGSHGVHPNGFRGLGDGYARTYYERYTLFNETSLRNKVLSAAAAQYGYPLSQVHLALCAGKFAVPTLNGEARIKAHLSTITAGGGPIEVYSLEDIIQGVYGAARASTYYDDPVLMTVKALRAAGHLKEEE